MPREQRVEDPVADERGQHHRVGRGDERLPPEGRHPVAYAVGAVDHQRQRQQRKRHDQRRPDRQPEATGHLRGSGDHVADRPRQRGEEAEEERDGGYVAAPAERHHDQADGAGEHPGHLHRARTLPEHTGRDHDGEHDLRLEHEPGEPGRHPRGHAGVEQPELAHAHEDPDRHDHPPGSLRAREQEDRRERDQDEPRREQQQRRHRVTLARLESPVDDDEVEAPQDGDEHGEQRVTAVHTSRMKAKTMKHHRMLLHQMT
ncbi:hypothetical protein GCM10010197_37570 [Nocardioides luteus]|uniref:Uncharacterized protein n=1 Tax=Nocardioides luteus TaxID=1844 RepID=A0ABQ5SVW2_9ACTN|nr:hypothetical protein GCM10010197_37570 [Nocardioides luteus]GLJ67954.1 hypothetical protein GCM10017579_19900 [Nocardioides luteus]